MHNLKLPIVLSLSLHWFGYCYSQPSTLLSEKEIVQLIPDKIIQGYSQAGSPKGKLIQVGLLRYSLAERNFVNGKKRIKILLFDYKEAEIMYAQATKRFSTYSAVDSDSLTCKPIGGANYVGWGTENRNSQSTQIVLGISNRFYLTLEGEGATMEELEAVIELINPVRFGKLN